MEKSVAGAVQSRLGPVLQRKAHQSYCWSVHERWDPKKHVEGEDEKEYHELEGEYRAKNQLYCAIKAGNDVCSKAERAHYHFSFSMDQSGPVGDHQVDVHKTASSVLPTRLQAGDDRFQKVGEIIHCFPGLIENLPVNVNEQGQPYRVLNYQANGKISGNRIDFEAWYEDKKVRQVNLDFDDAEPGGNFDSMAVD